MRKLRVYPAALSTKTASHAEGDRRKTEGQRGACRHTVRGELKKKEKKKRAFRTSEARERLEASDTGWSGTLAPPHVDCKWQTEFSLAAGAKMEADSFVRECERLSGRAGIGMISSLSSPKSPKHASKKTSVAIKRRKTGIKKKRNKDDEQLL